MVFLLSSVFGNLVWTLRALIVLLLIGGFSTLFEHEHEDEDENGSAFSKLALRSRPNQRWTWGADTATDGSTG
jgi:hypothetical protein